MGFVLLILGAWSVRGTTGTRWSSARAGWRKLVDGACGVRSGCGGALTLGWGLVAADTMASPSGAVPVAAAQPAAPPWGIIQLFQFEDFYEISLGILVAFLFMALGWSFLLRRRVREQTQQIRDQLERERALERRYAGLFENANDVVLSLDAKGVITTLNHAAETVLGCSREWAKTRQLSAFLVPEQPAEFERWRGRCAAGESAPFEATVSSSQGLRSVVELVGRPAREDGQPERLEIIGRNITERKRAEEDLRQSEERFSSAFRVSPVAIAIATRPEGRFIDVNQSFIRLFGYERDEVLDRTTTDLQLWSNVQDKTRIEKILCEQGSVAGQECRFRVKSGKLRTALVFIECITIGDATCILWITHDMTERLQLEEQVRHLLKMEAVGRLAAGVAHDFNNLLTVIQGNTDWVLAKCGRELEMTAPLSRVNEAVQRAANLTRQLLTFSRKQSIQLRPVDLNHAVTTATRMFKHLLRPDIILKLKFAPALPAVRADATMFEQVLMNLVVNARDAMTHGGDLWIRTFAATIDSAYTRKHPEATTGRFVCLEVSDTGCGMDAATLARIFEPFFTTKQPGKGTGLGLATVYGIVKQHLGWIEVTSDLGHGTTFTVFFPSALEVQAPPIAVADGLPDEGRYILLLENEPAVMEVLGRVLIDRGYHVLQASSGIEAMQIWSEHAAEVRVLVTDVRMPQGMSGVEVVENLWTLNPALRVVFVSGYAAEVPEQLLGNGALYLPKPCTPSALLEAVNRCLPLSVVADVR